MKKAYLSLGSNLGEKEKNLARAIRYINLEVGHVVDLSGIYETEPWGFESDSKFLNMVVEIVSDLTPLEMIDKCLEIETKLGRSRNSNEGYSSRIIDIDILFYENEIILEKKLILPHPHLQDRRFILEPLCDLAPDFVHPVLHESISALLANCADPSIVTQLNTITHIN